MHRHRHIARLSAAPTARLLTLGGLLVGFAVRLYRLGHESLWYDETVSVYLARLPLNTMISHTAGDIHPPGYYGLLHLWHSLTQPSLAHGLEFLYAWPSVVFGLLALPLLLVIARRLFGQRTAVAALWLAAFNPFLVWYSQEVRMYTLGAALGLLCLWAILQWRHRSQNAHPTSSPGWLAVYIFAAAAGLYTLYYFLFLLIALNLIAALLIWLHEKQGGQSKAQSTIHWFAAQSAVLLLWSPWLPIFWRQTTDPPVPPWRTTWDSPATFLHSLGETLAAPLVGQTPPATLTWPWALIGALLLFGLALLVTLHTSYQTTATGTKRIQVHAAIVIIYVFAPTAILYAATLLGAPIYHVRYLSLFAPLFLLVPALLLVVAWRHAHWLGAAMWVGLLAASALSLVAFWTDPLYRSDDHRQAVAELAQNWRPGDSILANAGWIYPVLSIYWPEQPIGGSGSAPPQLQPSTRLLDYAQNSAPESPILPRIIRSGSVDGPPSLGWGSLNADFFAISASDTRNTLAAIADSSQRIWHYRMYDTVSDPAGVIRTWLADNSAILLDNTIPGRDFGRVQLFGAEPLTRTLSAGQPAATFGGALALLDVTIPSTVTAGSYLYPTLLWQALPSLSTLPADLSASLRLYDSAGKQVAQADGPLGFLPTRAWPAHTTHAQSGAIPIPANLNESLYALHVIIYRQDNAQPVPVDATQEQAWQIGEVFVTRTEVQTISPSQFGLHLSSALY